MNFKPTILKIIVSVIVILLVSLVYTFISAGISGWLRGFIDSTKFWGMGAIVVYVLWSLMQPK